MAPIEFSNVFQSSIMIGNVIPLSTLMEFLIQRTYHELVVLSELLQIKTDLERKIEICQFANRTKQTFVRLLALVKWTNSANKVDKCARIFSFLQQQQMLFIETADCLARMARETLVHARLPSFSLPCAVDVLTTGTYSRLPFCIKEKIIPSEPLAPSDKIATLKKLTQIIEYRIVMNDLPHCMCKPIIENGRVKFTVDYEFEVYLTLMGDAPNLPWRLLNIDILVEDYESKSPQALVHPHQVAFIHELVQSRLIESDQPLHDLYNCLHFFCQSLQLEVLYFQSFNLIKEKFGDHIRVDEYNHGRNLTISYWRDSGKGTSKHLPTGCKLNIYVDEKNSNKPLLISHQPPILGEIGVKSMKQVNISCLSMERLLIHTIQIRCLVKLKELKRELELFTSSRCSITTFPPMMYVSSFSTTEEFKDEDLIITVDTMKGSYSVSTPNNNTNPFFETLEECLNSEKKDLANVLTNLRLVEKMDLFQNILSSHHLGFVDYSQKATPLHEIFGKYFFSLHYQNNNKYIMVINFLEKDKLKVQYFMTRVDEVDPISRNVVGVSKVTPIIDPPTGTNPHDLISNKFNEAKKVKSRQQVESSKKIQQLTHKLYHIHLRTEEMLFFLELNHELYRAHIHNTNGVEDQSYIGRCLQITHGMPMINMPNLQEACYMLNLFTLSITFRFIRKEKCFWSVKASFARPILPFLCASNKGHEKYFLKFYDVTDVKRVVGSFVDDWIEMCQLYQVSLAMDIPYNDLPSKSCITSYSYDKIVLSYGQRRQHYVSIEFDTKTRSFQLCFGVHADTTTSNPHSIITTHLTHHLNITRSLNSLYQVLMETSDMNEQLYKLDTSPLTCTKNFTLVAQTMFQYRLFFQSLFCLEVQCTSNNLLVIKDYSMLPFNKVSTVDNSSPLIGLQAFLKMHTSEILYDSECPLPTITDQPNTWTTFPTDDLMSSSSLLLTLQLNLFRSALDRTNQIGTSEFYMTCEAFNKMVTPITGNNNTSHLNKFLSAHYFKRHLQRIVQSDDNLIQVATTEPGVFMFKSDLSGLQMKFNININTSPLKIFPIQDTMSPWDIDDLFTLEKYFELKVFLHPFKPSNIEAFCSLFKMHYHILKDFVNIIRLELNPDKNMRWLVQLLLTFPSGFDCNIGVNAVVVTRRIMFILQLTWNMAHPSNADIPPANQPSNNIILPLYYDISNNTLIPFDNYKTNSSQIGVVASILKRFADYSFKTNECSIMPAIREIVNNLT